MLDNKKIKAVIFDWAGTTIDYGCIAPLAVFLEIFSHYGIPITIEEASKPMGKLKKEHIAELLQMERIRKEYKSKFDKDPDNKTVEKFYLKFEASLLKILPDYTQPLPDVIETINKLKKNYDIKIGSTTGYTKEMMEIIIPIVEKKGYKPDYIITSSEVKQGRPYPWMIYHNAINLGVFPMECIIKIGDTISDIEEGRNAGCWTVGVIEGSSTLGLSFDEFTKLDPFQKEEMKAKTQEKYFKAHADFVINSFKEIPELIEKINERLRCNYYPGNKIEIDSDKIPYLNKEVYPFKYI
jgi:phosphonoacetaldehyde hydrolase